jgi:hypothetical protein
MMLLHLWDIVYLNKDRDSEHFWLATRLPYAGHKAKRAAKKVLKARGITGNVDSAFYRGIVFL